MFEATGSGMSINDIDFKVIPDEVSILGSKYRVEQIPNYHLGDNKVLGSMSYAQKTIYICADQLEESKIYTFNHELIHAMFMEFGHLKYSMDEDLVEALTMILPRVVHNIINT